ncbi:MAG TPA: hypothetical protein VK932_20740 [Kofleriaceae bacterium]|nr:hypothetical protein [Kofleriaceae bacterium]
MRPLVELAQARRSPDRAHWQALTAKAALRWLVRPHLPPALRDRLREALPRSCQRADLVGAHSLAARVRGWLRQGLGQVAGRARALQAAPAREPLGAPSAFPPGSWVRVKDAAALREVLDERDRTRGLRFRQAQWDTAGELFQVARQVRRMRDDRGRFGPVSRTVLLDRADCAGHGAEPAGCGRRCPMMYRDEWLEPAAPPPRAAAAEPPLARGPAIRHARVRELGEIRAGLDLRGRRDGLTFMPEMAQYAGQRFPIASKLSTVLEHARWTQTRAPIYILGGLRCTGAVVGDKGPCDRACALMWHADWLIVEPPPEPAPNP